MHDLGARYFDGAQSYWDGRAKEAYWPGLEGVRKGAFLTINAHTPTARDAEAENQGVARTLILTTPTGGVAATV